MLSNIELTFKYCLGTYPANMFPNNQYETGQKGQHRIACLNNNNHVNNMIYVKNNVKLQFGLFM